jgi:hypothetical protein
VGREDELVALTDALQSLKWLQRLDGPITSTAALRSGGIDADPLVALADANEPRRDAILDAINNEPGSLVIPAPTTAELDYLLGQRFGDTAAGRSQATSSSCRQTRIGTQPALTAGSVTTAWFARCQVPAH